MVIRKIFYVLAIYLLGTLSVISGENMIRNGGFETNFTNIKDISTTWTIWGYEKGKIWENFTRDTENPHSGEACMKIYRPASKAGRWFSLLATNPATHKLTPKPGKQYTVTFWARTNKPGTFMTTVGSYRTIKPMTDGPSPANIYYKADENWRKFSLSFKEGLDMFANEARYMYISFFLATNNEDSNIEKTLWIDDVSMIEEDIPENQPVLINPEDLNISPLPLRLSKGKDIKVSVNTEKVTGNTSLKAGGVSMLSLSRWNNTPFSSTKKYNLHPALEKRFKALHLPMTRFYALLENEPFSSIEESIDAAAFFLNKAGIPPQTTILCLEPWHARTKFKPEIYERAVRHSQKNNYGFRFWEIGNEVYLAGNVFKKPANYVNHVIEVSKAIKAIQPEAQIGISISSHDTNWGNLILKAAAGYYDFVCPHLYGAFGDHTNTPFEELVLTDNHKKLNNALQINALLKAYNPNRKTYIYDTEWGLHSNLNANRKADHQPRNGNIQGCVYRAVRMIYYARENVVYGASSWKSLGPYPGFCILNSKEPEKTNMQYWLYYYFNRWTREKVLDIKGSVPYYQSAGKAYPLTPLMATASADGKTITLMTVNASWDKAIPATINLGNFKVKKHKAAVLKHDDRDAQPLLNSKHEFVNDLNVSFKGNSLTFTLPAHSIAFITLRK